MIHLRSYDLLQVVRKLSPLGAYIPPSQTPTPPPGSNSSNGDGDPPNTANTNNQQSAEDDVMAANGVTAQQLKDDDSGGGGNSSAVIWSVVIVAVGLVAVAAVVGAVFFCRSRQPRTAHDSYGLLVRPLPAQRCTYFAPFCVVTTLKLIWNKYDLFYVSACTSAATEAQQAQSYGLLVKSTPFSTLR